MSDLSMVICCDVWEKYMDLITQIGKTVYEMKKFGKSIGHSVWKAEGLQCYSSSLYQNLQMRDTPSSSCHYHTNGSLLIWMNMEGKDINVRNTIREFGVDFCSFIEEKVRNATEIPIGYDVILLDSFLDVAGNSSR
jgi:hypothetical protein